MRALFLPLLLFAPLWSAQAQWQAALLHGSAITSGDSRDVNGSETLSFLPDRPSSFSLTLGRDFGRTRVAIELRRTTADLALRGAGTTIVTGDALRSWGAGLEGSRRIAGRRGLAEVHAGVGVLLERWDFTVASDPRWRMAGRGSLTASVPISLHWSGVIRGVVSAGPSLFRAAELPEGYTTRTGWRRGVELGVGWNW